MCANSGKIFEGRVVLFGKFNLARDYHPGILIIIGIPLGTLVFLQFIILSPISLEIFPYSILLLLTCIILLLSILGEITMLALFFCDPGFTNNINDEKVHSCPVCRLSICDYDHHCGILGACIGGRNMGFFILFLIFVSLLMFLAAYIGIYIFLISLQKSGPYNSIREMFMILFKKEWWFSSKIRIFIFITTILLSYGGIFTGGLGLIYFFLIFKGKYSLQRRRKPWLKGSPIDVFREIWNPELSGTVLKGIIHIEENV